MKGEKRNKGGVFYACFEDLTKEVAWTVHIREVVNSWVKAKRSVTLFCPSSFPFNVTPRCRVVYVPAVDIRFVGEYLYHLLLPFYILFYRMKLRPKALYCREMGFMFLLYLVSRLIRVPLIVEINGFLADDLRLIGTSSIKILFFSFLQRINFKTADILVFVSRELADGYKDVYDLKPEKIYVVPNGVDTELFSTGDREGAIKNLIKAGSFKLDPKRRYITFVGSFYPHSSAPVIVEAAKYVVSKLKDVDFLMIGDGHDLPLCRKIADENMIADRVFFLGIKPHGEIPDFIRASSILIYITSDSRKWRNSMKAPEYMSSGGAMISNVKALFHVPLTHRGDYFFIEDATPQKLADGAVKLLTDERLREKIGRGARKLILDNFSWEQTAKRILEIIDRV